MAKAIRTALPETHHRWCRWHVLKSAKKKMSKTYAKHKRFKSDFYNLVTYELSIEGFEGSWQNLIKRYRDCSAGPISACLGLFQLISSHIILFILPAEYYSLDQPNSPFARASKLLLSFLRKICVQNEQRVLVSLSY